METITCLMDSGVQDVIYQASPLVGACQVDRLLVLKPTLVVVLPHMYSIVFLIILIMTTLL